MLVLTKKKITPQVHVEDRNGDDLSRTALVVNGERSPGKESSLHIVGKEG